MLKKLLVGLIFVLLSLGGVQAAETVDVVIIGAGGAGLAAAVEAHDLGSTVVVLEKMPMVGGNTLRATGGMNAAGTSPQQALGIDDSADLHYEDSFSGGREMNVPELLQTMVDEAPSAVEWLIELGADLSDVGRLGGSSVNRTHRPTGGAAVGAHLVGVLRDALDERGVDIRLQTTATELLTNEDGAVVGVLAVTEDGETHTFHATAVIVAAGGYGASSEMFVRFDSALEGFGTTNHPGATGDGIAMVEAIGGQLIHMDQVQTHPTVEPGRSTMITEAVRGNGGVLINRDGQRFVDELGTRDVVSEAILDQTGQTAFLVFDRGVRESLAAIENYINMGIVVQGDTLADLATALDINPDALSDTLAAYNEAVETDEDAEFGRSSLPRVLDQPAFYAVEIGPAVHHTMGGVLIDENARVMGEHGPIPGLFAAGEVTGGIHGANRLGGNALADIIVFGRIAGQQAAQ